jgi:enoyl-CoA hydratase/carnithine racemase
MSDFQTIRYQREGDIGTLTLARPGKRNARWAPRCCPTRRCGAWW